MTTSTDLAQLLEDPIFDAIDLSRNSDLPDPVIIQAQTHRVLRLALEFAALQLRDAARDLADPNELLARADALFPVGTQPADSGAHSGHDSP